MNRRIIISEDERSRILNLHETRKQKEWGLLFEQMAGAGEPTDLNLTDNKKPETGQVVGGGSQPKPAAQPAAPKAPATKDEIIAFQEWVVKNKKENIGTKDVLGKGPGVDGIFGAKSQAAWTKHSAEYNKTKEIQTSANDALTYTYYYKDATGQQVQKVFTTVDELNKAIAAKQITPESLVWRKDLGKQISVKDLNSPAINDAIASIAPEVEKVKQPGTTYRISPDGTEQSVKDYTADQLTAAVKAGTVTSNSFIEVRDASGKASLQPITQNPEVSKIVNLAQGAESVFKTSGIPELDAWLKGPVGSVWDKMEEGPLKEKSLDTYTKRDPQLKPIADKIGVGKLRDALGTQRSTAVGRMFSGLRKKGVEALGGTVTPTR